MRLHSMVIDHFLDDFPKWREWADKAEYKDVVNPADGVVYPGINGEIPDELRDEVHKKLCLALATNHVDMKAIFTRLSPQGVHVPHQAHTDAVMGMFSFMLYLNRPEHTRGGTDLIFHRQFDMEYGPKDKVELAAWERDMNLPDAWVTLTRCPMRPNRGFIFDARLMHRAAPIGGYGEDATNGRLVLTAFFDV
jgi:hypothetical protein